MLVCVFLSTFAHGTAGAARTRSSLRPSLLLGANEFSKAREHRAARSRRCVWVASCFDEPKNPLTSSRPPRRDPSVSAIALIAAARTRVFGSWVDAFRPMNARGYGPPPARGRRRWAEHRHQRSLQGLELLARKSTAESVNGSRTREPDMAGSAKAMSQT